MRQESKSTRAIGACAYLYIWSSRTLTGSSQSACAFVREGHLDPRDFFYVARRRRTTARGWHRQRDGEEEEGPSVRRVVLVLRVRVRAGVGRELTCAAENSKMRKVRGLRDELSLIHI